ncbi:AraC family transcriptional regulator [Pseudomonas typographi]|uniref:AraC family transcriptional regulator n=1 Tax=Pseudomonas typographi TaxID=2715964 RepID=UPI0016846D65|nr:helix-turn-helix transcriptional regulator [Pseudomonas typographi]MBD1550731.1 helix-turn-helix transcriptional regulator [Pseudomonas typographi]MBD1588662.1 helix-turn-helix transcriptional regulator [Pseudomonas typographi]
MPSALHLDSPLSVEMEVSLLSRSYRRGTQLGYHVHRQGQLLYAYRGLMQVTTLSGRWLVPPQRAVWLPAFREHAIDVLADIEMRTFFVEPSRIVKQCGETALQNEFVIEVNPLLRESILAMFQPNLTAQRLDLLSHIALLELPEAGDATTFIPMPTDPRARRVAELALEDIQGIRDIDELATAAGSSARTIARLFVAETDITFKKWRQRARILAALEMLNADKMMIKQIAHRAGYASVAAFSAAFIKVMGMTPSEFQGRIGS